MSGIRTCTQDQDTGLIQWLEEPDRSRLQPASLKSEVLIKAEHNSGNHANLFAVLHGLQHCTLFTDSLTICLSYQFYITVTDITNRCLNLQGTERLDLKNFEVFLDLKNSVLFIRQQEYISGLFMVKACAYICTGPSECVFYLRLTVSFFCADDSTVL